MKNSEALRVTRQLFDQLNAIISEWDPYGLSKSGEIADEWNDEVWVLLHHLPGVDSSEEAMAAVAKAFDQTFIEYGHTPPEYAHIGERVYEWWRSKN
jgi:hypothetical protein